MSLGVKDGKLAECPKSPNCVSTQSTKSKSRIDPINFKTSKTEALGRMVDVINSIERTKIITKEDNYIHAEFRTKLFKFVDDVEFFFDDENKVIHFRSASRVGYGDMGVNRKRMEDIRDRFLVKGPNL